jgi:glycosylphosphatidylinositol transamidase (GPIT) subunit GPI8
MTGQIFNSRERGVNLYSADVEVDYRGTDVSVESFLRLLTGILHLGNINSSFTVTSQSRRQLMPHWFGSI